MLEAILLALVSIGSPPCQSGPHDWEVEYADSMVESYASPGGELTFSERPYRAWRSRSRYQGYDEWGPWTEWRPAVPYPGDADGSGDCIVSNADFLAVRSHLGEQCP